MIAGLRNSENSIRIDQKESVDPDRLIFESTEDLTLEDLLRRLITKVDSGQGSENASCQSSIERTGPILEIDIDCFHYTLVRSIPTSCHLSPREQEIVRLVAEGLPNKCISAVLEISSWTVATHLRRIFAKLHVTSRAAMVAKLLAPKSGTEEKS